MNTLLTGIGITGPEEAKEEDEVAQLSLLLGAILEVAQERGYVITVWQDPIQPFAMGNYKTAYSIHKKGPHNAT